MEEEGLEEEEEEEEEVVPQIQKSLSQQSAVTLGGVINIIINHFVCMYCYMPFQFIQQIVVSSV